MKDNFLEKMNTHQFYFQYGTQRFYQKKDKQPEPEPQYDYSQDYLTFVTLENGTFSFNKNGTGDNIQYSLDEGDTWTSLESEGTVSVNSGKKILWKATLTPSSSSPNFGIGTFSSTGQFNVEGNAMSLLYGDNFKGQTSLNGKDYAFYMLFQDCTNLVSAENLSLPATTLASSCYSSMFNGCTSLTTASELIATTLVEGSYYEMFRGCSRLNYIKCLATDISATNSTNNWVNGLPVSGTFVKAASMTQWTTGDNGIPSGWTVEEQ